MLSGTVIVITIRRRKLQQLDWAISLVVVAASIILLVSGQSSISSATDATLASRRPLRIVEWNAANHIEAAQVQRIFAAYDADIAVFPELEGDYKGDRTGRRLQRVFTEAGLDTTHYDLFYSKPTEGSIAPVTIVVKKSLGQYQETDTRTTTFGTVVLTPQQSHLPAVIGLHTAPPIPGLMTFWEGDLQRITETLIPQDRPALIIGDFNATMKHGSLTTITTHYDALSGMIGTWPRRLPAFLRSPIDHVLIPKQYQLISVTVEDLGTSDHAAVFVEVGVE